MIDGIQAIYKIAHLTLSFKTNLEFVEIVFFPKGMKTAASLSLDTGHMAHVRCALYGLCCPHQLRSVVTAFKSYFWTKSIRSPVQPAPSSKREVGF